ncbi:PrsW family intramembrane metalloprotease [Natronosalvus caseinilyticus]|uniref:PrsW family intramembrane metalloprotease n=1 Tax=Natronosalvus caseinilyticus TaxID=2953747 RepID=UPI0028ADD90F|nr:PrsW family intramembrane metalloprotease [Natronosalvus caseinilyticus]
MASKRDPIERAAGSSADLYDVSTWEPRSRLDRFAAWLYAAISYGLHAIVLAVALLITISLLASPTFLVLDEPLIGAFFALSVVPAALLAAYIWYADITTSEPLSLLVSTFVLAVLFATFAAVTNTFAGSFLRPVPIVGTILFFYLVVGPVEEAVKLLAVRVFAFRSDSFDAVIDGAVYGAVAGLGFAAIENALYITQSVGTVGAETSLFAAAGGITTTRALAGPGHVIYSAVAGYYLGLAKFNPTNAGPIVVKGLLVAAFIHATYNVTVQIVPPVIAAFWGLGPALAVIVYVVVYDGLAAFYLYRKLSRYRRTYRAVRDDGDDHGAEMTEFEPGQR